MYLKLVFDHQFLLVFVYLMCDSRQLFFQYGPETPKVWTPMLENIQFLFDMMYKLVVQKNKQNVSRYVKYKEVVHNRLCMLNIEKDGDTMRY